MDPVKQLRAAHSRRSVTTLNSLRSTSSVAHVVLLHHVNARSSCQRGVSCSSQARAAPRSRQPVLQIHAVFERFTERSIKSVVLAQNEAKNLGCKEVTTGHVLLGLIAEDRSSTAAKGYLNSGVPIERVRAVVTTQSLQKRVVAGAPVSEDTPAFSNEVKRMFEATTTECKRLGVNFIAPEHILLALLNLRECNGRLVLDYLKVDTVAMKAEANRRLKGDAEDYAAQPKKQLVAADKTSPKKPGQAKALEDFCRDLCAEARHGRIDPVIGRDREVQRVCQILARRSKNNPILLGEPGVGKTAIAEGLALCIVRRMGTDGTSLPEFLWDKRVLTLDLGCLMAGAKERGELESRVTRLIQETKAAGNVILMIDEIHMLIGAGGSLKSGGSGGGLDIGNILKPALARGEFQVIGATTVKEHRKYIEKDAALERRFQPVYVDEPTQSEAVDILLGLRDKYERHHRCVYTDDALRAAVDLSAKYIADRQLPDKAIDLMDEAGSAARILAYGVRRTMAAADHPKVRDYLAVLATKDDAVREGLFEEAEILRRREVDYRAELCGDALEGSSIPVVNVSDIERIAAQWTGIPVERMDQDEQGRLLQLASRMKEHLIGQSDAVDAVAGALRRSRCGLSDPKRPIAAMLFVGPTGVGKTELARVLAEQYFGSRDALIRLDMSEYMERHSVSKLVGAPPGYIGYGEGGKLTEAVRRQPCSLVLMDEIEKAHPDVFNILLQILEDGRLTDSQGRVVSFKNTMIILTSNVGSRIIANSGAGVSHLRRILDDAASPLTEADAGAMHGHIGGGGGRQRDYGGSLAETSSGRARLRDMVLDEVKTCFKPELLNRFDEQVVFHSLGRSELRTIYGLMIGDTLQRVKAMGFTLEVRESLAERILSDGYSREYGARPLRQTIVRYIDDPLSEALLDKQFAPGSVITMDCDRAGAVTVYSEDDVRLLDAAVPEFVSTFSW